MAITYSEVFGRIKRVVHWDGQLATLQTTTLLGTDGLADDVLDEFNARRDLVKTFQANVEGYAATVGGWRSQLKGTPDAVLADLQAELNAATNAPASLAAALAARMATDGESVVANVVSAPVVTAGGSNVGNGVLVASVKNAAGVDDERVISETVVATCTADAGTGGTAGGETFMLVGRPVVPWYGGKAPGSGSTALNVADTSNLVTNGTFEAFTANVPDGWTPVAGTAGTHVLQELSSVHRGAGALKLDGDGVATTVTLTYPLATLVTPSTIYALGAWVRKSGTVATTSNLQIAIKGTGFTAANAFNADPNGLTTSYANKAAFFTSPAVVPSDFRVEITWTAANNAGASALILVDDVVVRRPTGLGNVQYAAFAGSTNFVRGDVFTVVTANDYAGDVQTYFNRAYNVALPSSGTPTIADP